jgi:hypothetical protein
MTDLLSCYSYHHRRPMRSHWYGYYETALLIFLLLMANIAILGFAAFGLTVFIMEYI